RPNPTLTATVTMTRAAWVVHSSRSRRLSANDGVPPLADGLSVTGALSMTAPLTMDHVVSDAEVRATGGDGHAGIPRISEVGVAPDSHETSAAPLPVIDGEEGGGLVEHDQGDGVETASQS